MTRRQATSQVALGMGPKPAYVDEHLLRAERPEPGSPGAELVFPRVPGVEDDSIVCKQLQDAVDVLGVHGALIGRQHCGDRMARHTGAPGWRFKNAMGVVL